MTEGKLSFLWIASTVLLLIAVAMLDKFWAESKWFFLPFFALLIFIIGYYLYERTNKTELFERELSKKLMDAREDEKRRIAAALHDGLQQNLHSINFELQRLAKTLPGARQELRRVSERIIGSIDDIRSISSKLYPHQLENLGLKKSIEAMANNLTDSSEVYFSSNIADGIDTMFDPEASINIYRIIQELFNNIIKHSNASTANIRMQADRRSIRIVVEDDGRGLGSQSDKVNSFKEGLGTRSIWERLKLMRGSLKLDSRAGKGTQFRITIPLRNIYN